MIIAGLCFVSMTGVIRGFLSEMNPFQAAFIRYVFGSILVIPIIIKLGFSGIRSSPIGLFATRGIVHGIAVMLWFFSMTRIPVAEVSALGFTSTIFTIIGAIIFLKEPLYRYRIVAVLFGLTGTLLILRPGFKVIEIGTLALLASAILTSCSLLMAKHLTRNQNNTTIIAFLSIFAMLALLPFAFAAWRTPNLSEIFWLLMTAILATTAHYAMNKAFTLADITSLQPIMFLQLIWATLLGLLIFDEHPDLWVWLGGAVIVITATITSNHESRLQTNPKTKAID
ncbi:MAG: EamA family transporter [Acidiferrobacteraceae bacterium]|jgi:drug/metabolite transporter (DMT)-like permease|nr:EamA family transporter [Acidiferrobacteraceae bacterium]